MTKYNNGDLRRLLEITSAISDETRIRILMLLDIHELCVCQITEALELAPSTISKHLSILENADLIRRRKVGRWVYYSLSDAQLAPIQDVLRLVNETSCRSAKILADRQKIRALLKEDTNVICRRLYHGEKEIKDNRGRRNAARVKA